MTQTQTKIIYCYCKKIMQEGTEPASHGACPECYKRVTAELDEIPAEPIAQRRNGKRLTPFPAEAPEQMVDVANRCPLLGNQEVGLEAAIL